MTKKFVLPIATLVALGGLVAGLYIGGAHWKPALAGLPDAGLMMTWAEQISKLGFTFVGLLLFGRLITITFLVKATDLRKELNRVGLLGNIWIVFALIAAVTQMSYVLGMNLKKTFEPGIIQTYLIDLAPSRGYLISAAIALVVVMVALIAKAENTLFVMTIFVAAGILTPLLNSHSASLGDHSLALTSSVVHGLAVSAWVGALLSITPQVKAGDQKVIYRFSVLAKWAVVALAISGAAAAYTRLDSISDFYQTGYGRLVVIKVVLFIAALSLVGKIRANVAKSLSVAKFVSFELFVMVLATGFGVALQNTALSRAGIKLPTAAEEVLGFEFPPAPSFSRYVFGWHPEWVMLSISVVALVMYLSAVVNLKRNSVKWPIGRTIAFVIGILLLSWSSSSGIAKYAMVSFSSHMIQHMMLSMITPIFLVLGAPVTLALRRLPTQSDHNQRNARDWILALLQSSYARFITHPIAVLIIFTFGLYGMYFTPLFGDLMRSHVGHVYMEIHFLFSGFLFSFMAVGIDPAPRVIAHPLRLMMVLVAMAIHAFFAIAIMQSTTPLGEIWYHQVQPPWIFDLLQDTYTGGGVAWAVGEVPSFMLAILVIIQWARSDERLAKQQDRAAQRDGNRELNSYNDRLAKLSQLDKEN